MGQKAKNAGKKKSKSACNKVEGRQGIIRLTGKKGQEPSQEFINEVSEILKTNFHSHLTRKFRGNELRNTDIDRNTCLKYSSTHLTEQDTLN